MTFKKAQYPSFKLAMLCLFSILLFNSFNSNAQYSKEELLGKINPASNSSFSLVPEEYCNKSGIYLRTEVLEAFLILRQLAEDEGITLIIISGTRSFNHQKSIWDRKWGRTRYMGWQEIDKAIDILTYSSMPGTSRHHWGTDIDFNSLENSYFDSGYGLKVYEFLKRCGEELGFKQVYTSKKGGRTGYEEEKWHWSYMPTSSVMLEKYNKLVSIQDLGGFNGSQVADSLQIIDNFVNGIAK